MAGSSGIFGTIPMSLCHIGNTSPLLSQVFFLCKQVIRYQGRRDIFYMLMSVTTVMMHIISLLNMNIINNLDMRLHSEQLLQLLY